MIQKNVNMFLLGLVILATVVNVVAAIVYHASYGSIDANQAETVKALKACEQEKQSATFSRDEALTKLGTQQAREQEFADQFVDTRQSAESLETQLKNAKSNAQVCQSRITVIQKELDDAKTNSDSKTQTISDLFKQNKKLKDDLNDCESDN